MNECSGGTFLVCHRPVPTFTPPTCGQVLQLPLLLCPKHCAFSLVLYPAYKSCTPKSSSQLLLSMHKMASLGHSCHQYLPGHSFSRTEVPTSMGAVPGSHVRPPTAATKLLPSYPPPLKAELFFCTLLHFCIAHLISIYCFN